MNIILTAEFSPWSAYCGGAQRSTHHLATALCRRGHDVSVVYTKPPWEQVASPRDLPYQIHWATFFDVRSRRKAPLRPLNALAVARVVADLLARKTDAVVHANGEEGGMIHRLRRRHRFGFIATPRDSAVPAMVRHYDRLSPLRKLWLLCTQGKYLMQGRAARQADLCIPPSAFAAALFRDTYHVDPTQMRVVPNGVPEEFLDHEHAPPALEQGPLVFFGRFDAIKGVDVLVEALGLLGAQAPPTLIIGQGGEKANIEKRVEALGLAGKVTLRPWMTHHELAQTLASARMAVLPSRKENFSLAILGAMAVGTPVISTRVGGTPEIITHGRTGLLVEPDRPVELAQAIAHLLYNPDLAYRLGQAGRAHVRTHFTWDRVAAAFEALYQSLPALAHLYPCVTYE